MAALVADGGGDRLGALLVSVLFFSVHGDSIVNVVAIKASVHLPFDHHLPVQNLMAQAQEKKLIVKIKKSAKQGQMGIVRVILIRTRHQIEQFSTRSNHNIKLVNASSVLVSTLDVNTKVAKAKATGNEVYYFI
ncbi:hypothetical protein Dimus_016201 [Dionaea muscipula]